MCDLPYVLCQEVSSRELDHDLAGCKLTGNHRDLLQRHYTVHGKAGKQETLVSANSATPRSAGRTPIACNNCARTKTKCDRKHPCSRCASRNLHCAVRPIRRAPKNTTRGEPQGVNTVFEHDRGTAGVTSESLHTFEMAPNDGSPHSSSAQLSGASDEDQQMSAVSMLPHFDLSSGKPVTSSTIHAPTIPCTPYVACDDFSGPTEASAAFDWSQVPISVDLDAMVDPTLLMGSTADLHGSLFHFAPPVNGSLPLKNSLSGDAVSLIAPFQSLCSPNGTLTGLQSSCDGQPRRMQSLGSQESRDFTDTPSDGSGDSAEAEIVRDAWTVFRCNPTISSTSCPKTAKMNLERLQQVLRDDGFWTTWSAANDMAAFADASDLRVAHVHEHARDKLLAITQIFLHKSLEIHSAATPASHGSSRDRKATTFVLLPPPSVLECLLCHYAISTETHYPLTSRGSLDANELMNRQDDRASSLLVLMMVARGAMSITSVEGGMLANGLTEVCRISIFDLIEKDVTMCGNPTVLRAALLFTVQAAWSGDKWQMDIAMGQRGMYFAMLRHTGALESRPALTAEAVQHHSTEQLWHKWSLDESRSRLAYSWMMVDQELALFHDTASLLSVTEFAVPMPDTDRLWNARTAAGWSSIFEEVHEFVGRTSSVGSGARPLPLKDLFRHFLGDELVSFGIETTPLQLRLLLHPLQSLVWQASEILTCFSDTHLGADSHEESVTAASTRTRLREVQCLLERWLRLVKRYLSYQPLCKTSRENLILFHLISMNAISDFPAMERFARRDADSDPSPSPLQRCIRDRRRAIFHSGQVLRLIRGMENTARPTWWAGAVYRAGLILWCQSFFAGATYRRPPPSPSPELFAIDDLQDDHPFIARYLNTHQGRPCVTKTDGSRMELESGTAILEHIVEVIREGQASGLSEGICYKLERLAHADWDRPHGSGPRPGSTCGAASWD